MRRPVTLDRVVGIRVGCVHDAHPGAPLAVCGFRWTRKAMAREVARLAVCRRCRARRA